MSHDDREPQDCDHEKHLQLGCDLSNDDRTSVEDPDDVWADACTVEEFAEGIEELRAAGWPVGT